MRTAQDRESRRGSRRTASPGSAARASFPPGRGRRPFPARSSSHRSRPPPAPCRRAAHRRRRSSPPRAWRRTGRCWSARGSGRAPAPRARPAPTRPPGRRSRRVAACRQRSGAAGTSGPASSFKPMQRGRRSRHQEADQRGRDHDHRKRNRQEVDADEGRPRDPEQHRGLERALADADERLDHDHQHGGLDAEQRAIDERDAAPERIERGSGPASRARPAARTGCRRRARRARRAAASRYRSRAFAPPVPATARRNSGRAGTAARRPISSRRPGRGASWRSGRPARRTTGSRS